MAAHGVKLETLKDCLQFLEWLKGRKWSALRNQLSGRLKRLLDKKYENVNQQQIEGALSIFLGHVSTFHNKLCKTAAKSAIQRITAKDALEAVLQCIPKLLSVIYFLQYHVDKRFAKVGGGDWANDMVGSLAMYVRFGPDYLKRMISNAGPIDKYLIATADTNAYGVIPGGFDPGELKELARDGYNQGSLMTGDLVNIFDKEKNPNNLFRDVFVTSAVSKNSAVEISNVANALRLVEDFCGIFEKVKGEDDFKSNLQARYHCISWLELKRHCSKIKRSLGSIFKGNRFSFNGYARPYDKLKTEDIATKMAKWLKNNLDAIRGKLKITSHKLDVKTFVTTNLIPYGFTFNGYNVGTGKNDYKALKKDWDAVIGELKKANEGLDKLKQILGGNQCSNGKKDKQPKRIPETNPEAKPEPEPEPRPEPEPEPGIASDSEPGIASDSDDDDETWGEDLEFVDEALGDEDAAPISPQKEAPPVKVPDAPKEVVSEQKVVKPTATKSEATKPATLKAEATPNQGKKAEGGQNQGKKAEGAPDQPTQNNGQSELKPLISPGGDNASPSSAEPLQPSSVASPDPKCSNGKPPIYLGFDSGKTKYCPRDGKTWDISERKKLHEKWDEQKQSYEFKLEQKQKEIEERLKRQKEAENLKMEVEERIKEDERQLQREAMLPRIDVVYRPQELSENLDVAYNTAAQRHLNRFVSPMPFDIIKPTNLDAVIDDSHGTPTTDINEPAMGGSSGIEVKDLDGAPVQNTDQLSKQNQDYYSTVDTIGSPYVEGDEIPDPFFSDKRQTEIDKEIETSQKNMDSKLRYRYYQGLGDAQNKWKKSLVDTEQAEKEERKRQIDARIQNVIERVRERNERKNKAAQNLDKKFEKTTENIWKTQLQQNLDYIEENVEDEDAKKRVQQKRLRQQKQLDQQNVSHDSPTSTVSALPSQPGNPAPAPSSQNTGGRDGHRRIPFVPREEDLMQRGDDVIYPDVVYSDPVDPFAKYGYGLGEMYTSFDGQPVVDKRREKEEKLLREKNKNDAKKRWVESHQRLYAQTHANSGFSGTPTGDSKGLAEAMPFHDNASVGIPMGMVLKPKKPAIAFPPLPQKKFGPGTPAVPQGIDLTKNKRPTKLPSVTTPNDTTYVTGEIDIIPIQHSTDISGAPIKDVTNKIPIAKVQDTLDYKLLLPDQPTGYPITNSNQDTPVQQPPPKFKPSDVSGSITSGFISDVESWRKKEIMYNNIKRDLEAHKKALANDQERRIKEAQRYGEGFKKMVHMHDDDRNQHLLDDVQESTEKLKLPSPRKLQDIVYPNDKPYVAPPVIDTLPHGLQSTEATGDVSKTFIDVKDSESLAEVGLSVDVLKQSPFQPLNDYDYGRTFMPPPVVAGGQLASTLDSPRLVSERSIPLFANPHLCTNPWSVSTSTSSTDTPPPPASPPPLTDHLPPPKTVREMLYWFVGLSQYGLIGVVTEHVYSLLRELNKDTSHPTDAIEVTGDPTTLTASNVTTKLTEACLYSATVIYKVRHNNDFKAFSTFDFKSVYSQFRYSSDPACLLCQLRDYAYACHYQLEFLKAQCNRVESHGGWQNCKYGSDTKTSSPLQAFLTDGWDSDFDTHLFDPCNLCLKSRIRMGFKRGDLPEKSQTGGTISTILSPSCGGSDPLLTLSSYLNCITRRTPRTTGELVSYFHYFGNSVYKALSQLPPISPSLILRLPTHQVK
ncbi:hypothetical protein BBBOND_0403660 [Babesia bigemina]|uniref:Ribosome-binding protein 1 n=1 Tax=Babesia bigemina TaxID=5866 RepID=A0A061DBG3_BABBI|nr:hypothetical protein BBBOND_0403660 [Babesia bigemina]CDR97878.1 hypothetical protein BBBOND_0403660 [Babesia bigemina]|eukprot:XP_012770064.1 hypothetical protein BBBOND_0403660 [Babesia bigemina]